MQVKHEFKSHTHVLTLLWGDSKLRLEFGLSMALTSKNVPPGVISTIRRLHDTTDNYPAFVRRTVSAATESTDLATFLRRLEHHD